MSFGTILYTILIRPLQMFFEFIYSFAQGFTDNPGLSIIVLSLTMNFLVLPLYKRADSMQAEERNTEKRLHNGIKHIKSVFSGDERMMVLQEYYRQNNYSVLDSIKGSVSLFLEIPFFIGAYQFLSHLAALHGASFGPLKDLGAPDGMLVTGGLAINLLPILMTLINIISGMVYTKGFPAKAKIQIYTMAVFFLFFLYNSPSGLVFYWTLNNIFSLCKNIVYKKPPSQKFLVIIFSAVGSVLVILSMLIKNDSYRDLLVLPAIGVVLYLVLILYEKKRNIEKEEIQNSNRKMFVMAAAFLTAVLGLLIPSAVIQSSSSEFADVFHYHNPIWFIISAFCLSFGTFFIWFSVFYGLAGRKRKITFEKIMWVGCGVSIVDYMFFGTNLGTLSSDLRYDNDFEYTKLQILGNTGLIVFVALVMLLVLKHFKKMVTGIIMAGILAVSFMAVINTANINNAMQLLKKQIAAGTSSGQYILNLSKSEKNVVVIMLDRAIGPYIPYLFQEKAELKKEFDGFTYYPNTISYGKSTNFGSPALFGGYEYVPAELNKRSTESLASKQNEALKVMPVLFEQNGFDVTVCDPTYANYHFASDTSVYNDYPDIHTYVTKGRYLDEISSQYRFSSNNRNFFCYSLMKCSPLLLQYLIYDNGRYMQPKTDDEEENLRYTHYGTSVASGLNLDFMGAYNVLEKLPEITKENTNSKGSFILMTNDTTHDVILLQEPEYEPEENVDNTEYDNEHLDRFSTDGKEMNVSGVTQYSHYECNMGAMLRLGEWFDYLRANNCYDNTRIILVSDHGRTLKQFSQLIYDNGDNSKTDMEGFAPLLMVKDFNSTGFKTSDEFMTNGDVPTLATEDIIQNPKNPMTGKAITNDVKYSEDQYVLSSDEWSTATNNGTQFLPGDWYAVHDNLWDMNNRKRVAINSTSPN